jgi:ABC-type uncharacterized transport system involved in gliding motility auxiliary subunit
MPSSPSPKPSRSSPSVWKFFQQANWRSLGPYFLALGILALLVCAVLYFLQRSMTSYVLASLVVGVLGLLAFILWDPDRILQWLGGRQAHYGSNVLLMGLAFLGILVVANWLSSVHNKQWDLTQNKTNTLAPETLQTLATLSEPAQVRAYYSSSLSSEASTARHLFDEYQNAAHGKFSYRFIDPNANPVQATQDNVTQDGTVVVAMDGRSQSLNLPSETDLTTALVQLANPGVRKIYFLVGHGEADSTSSDNAGMSLAAALLKAQGYTSASLNLLVDKSVPADAKAVIVAGPQDPLQSSEVDALAAYLQKGGGLVVLEDPTVITNFGSSPDPLADYLANTWGVSLDNDIVVDTNSQSGFDAIAASYGSSTITDKLLQTVSIFRDARSLGLKAPSSDITQVALVQTGPQSWGEMDLAGLKNNQISFDPKLDRAGPLTVAATAQSAKMNSRLVIFGDSAFGRNANFNLYANGRLLVNSIDWASQQGNLINLTPRTPTTSFLVPPSALVMNAIALASIVLLPGVFIVAGGLVWFARRRHQ